VPVYPLTTPPVVETLALHIFLSAVEQSLRTRSPGAGPTCRISANERLKRNRTGQVVLQLKSSYKDGTTHIVMEPLEFMARLAALVPHPRLHLIRFHGVLAPNAKLRSKIVPAPPERATETSSESAHTQGAPARMSWSRLLKRVFDIDVKHCPNCGGTLKIIAAIEDPPVIVKILSHLGLPSRAHVRAAL
jgi:hypothetical protein